ncbi:MAG TPA: acyl-CoA desaturase [Solirubrobacteraceae bacterium]|nr:acyl-CoA desaturase [Solirubrobacteraceae bacterium]
MTKTSAKRSDGGAGVRGGAEASAAPRAGLPNLTPAQIERFGRELDALRERVRADLGERDANYIRRMIALQRTLELGGRGMLYASLLPPAWLAGTAALSLAKILDNMEIGHNVMHGQYDWMGDPRLIGERFEWDTVCPADQWRHSHNYIHHTFTNIVGKDRDLGYGILRVSERQPWRPYYLGNPLYATLLALLFQWGVAFHDLEVERVLAGEASAREKLPLARAIFAKARAQLLKDYVLYPALAGPLAPAVFAGNLSANLTRNVWAFAIIFCGHFPDGTQAFGIEQSARESRGEWYLRQVLGSANISGGPLLHVLSGNLSHQIEHHLFPELPAHRYADIAVEVRAILERYGVPYNSGPLHRQLGTVARRLARLSLPDQMPLQGLARKLAHSAEPPARLIGSGLRLSKAPLTLTRRTLLGAGRLVGRGLLSGAAAGRPGLRDRRRAARTQGQRQSARPARPAARTARQSAQGRRRPARRTPALDAVPAELA